MIFKKENYSLLCHCTGTGHQREDHHDEDHEEGKDDALGDDCLVAIQHLD